MSIPPLTIVPAGAGSGKTYTIQTKLAEWIIAGDVAPDRIVAVTFTEAAAAELKGRIRGQLVAMGRLDDALKLDQAYISTIHGFGLRILKEFAFDAGISPQLRKLSEDEENILIRLALNRTDRTDAVITKLISLGYKPLKHIGKSPEELFRDAILEMIGKRRSVSKVSEDAKLLRHAQAHIKALYGPMGKAEDLKKELLVAVRALLRKYPSNLSSVFSGVNNTAEKDMRTNFDDLKRAATTDALDTDWALWNSLRKLRMSGQKGKLPDGYKELAEDVKEAAEGILRHPGPLQDALDNAEALLGGSQDVLNEYAKDKREKGLIDFFDMLAQSHNIVLSIPGVLNMLKDRVDCLVIDEFQDTNPLQFALLWSLRKAGVPALIVGDLKQAIMGFQDADSRLMEELECQFAKCCEPLKENWRSTPKLMTWINAIGRGLFKNDYMDLTPKAKYPSTLDPLEAIVFPKETTKAIRAQNTAVRVAALLAGQDKVYVGHINCCRSIRPSDIAIMCFTHDRLAEYAAALQTLGIRTRMEQNGWFSSRVIQLMYYALSFVADPSDRHAALYLTVTELGNKNLESALKELFAGKEPDSPVLSELNKVAAGPADITVPNLVRDVIEALDLYGKVSIWPDIAQARANLLRLQGMADQFENANREALASGRYYGSGIKTFLAWLNAAVEDDDGQPTPSVVDEQAVQLVTWHGSKGREWPIVVVAGLDTKVEARLQRFDVSYQNFSDLGRILDKALIEISPVFPFKEKNDMVLASLQKSVEEDARRLLYVMLTRAREKLVLEWHGYFKADSNVYWNLLTRETALTLDGMNMIIGGQKFPCIVTKASDESPSEFETEGITIAASLPVIGRRAIKPGKIPTKLTPEAVTPSSMYGEGEKKVTGLKTETYGVGVELTDDLAPMERGLILHRYLEIMGGRNVSIELARRGTDYDLSEREYLNVKRAVDELDTWITKYFSPLTVQREVPILALNSEGSVVSGVIDLLVEISEGLWIIDHKTDTSGDLDATFAQYYPQLAVYRNAVSMAMPGKKVLGVGINWVTYGKVTLRNREVVLF